MSPKALSLPPAEFERIFPFHLALDAELRILQVGPVLQRICPDAVPGSPFASHFRIRRPRVAQSFAALQQQSKVLFLLTALGAPLTLKGQMLPLPDAGTVLFLGSPWVTTLDELQALGISLGDFAVHDPITDYLMLLRTQQTALGETQQLARQLSLQQDELIATNLSLSAETRRLVETQGRLSESEQRYRSVVDNVKEVIFQTDATGRWTFLNRVWTELTGYDVAESLGANFLDFVHPDDRALSQERFKPLIERKKADCRHETRYLTKSGGFRWIEVFARLTVDADDQITGTSGTLNDITERRYVEAALQKERDFIAAVIDTADSLIVVFDRNGYIVRFNRACERMTGYDLSKVRSRPIWDLLPPDERDTVRSSFADVAAGGFPRASEHHWISAHGQRRLIAWSNTALYDAQGAVEYVISTGIDITDRRTVELALLASERKYRHLVDHSQGLICVHDLDGTLHSVNPASATLLGYQPYEMVGRNLVDFLSPDGREGVFEYLTAIVRDGRTSGIMFVLNKAGEERVWLYHNSLEQNDGEPPYVLGYAQDITELKRAEDALRDSSSRLAALISNLQAAVLVENQARQIVLTNQLFCDLFQIPAPPAALVGADCSESAEQAKELFADPEQFVQRVDAILRERRVVTAEQLQLADGRTLERDYVPIYHEGVYLGHLWQYRNITERKRIEADLAHARDAALESSRLKSEFLATMSHEIRTPMNGVIGMAELLLSTALDAEQREFAQIVLDSGQALLTIINDILDYSKIEAGKVLLEHEDFELSAVVGAAVSVMSGRARAKGLALSSTVAPGVPARLCGDPGRLRQVLLNLLGNAVKFTERGQIRVEVGVVATTPEAVQLRFAVVDTGIGVAPSARQRLFEPFTQADGSVTRRYGGTGLGLAISKRIVELMGGSIGVDSQEQVGSAFWFVVPLRRAVPLPRPVEMPRQAPAQPALSGHVLLVDDHPVNRQLARRQLEALGCSVEVAVDGREAVAALSANAGHYALVLMDIQMPVMDGYAATRAIRELERVRGGHVPIIAMTASAAQSDREACAAAGMDDYLSKPVRRETLTSVLTRWLVPAAQGGSDVLLDAELFEALRALDPEEYAAVVGAYAEAALAALAILRQALRAEDAAALVKEAHRLRGSSAAVGALALAGLCAALESNGLADAAPLIERIATDVAAVCASLEAGQPRG